jgi:hypothetical protein
MAQPDPSPRSNLFDILLLAWLSPGPPERSAMLAATSSEPRSFARGLAWVACVACEICQAPTGDLEHERRVEIFERLALAGRDLLAQTWLDANLDWISQQEVFAELMGGGGELTRQAALGLARATKAFSPSSAEAPTPAQALGLAGRPWSMDRPWRPEALDGALAIPAELAPAYAESAFDRQSRGLPAPAWLEAIAGPQMEAASSRRLASLASALDGLDRLGAGGSRVNCSLGAARDMSALLAARLPQWSADAERQALTRDGRRVPEGSPSKRLRV